jgi:hypothetical protein
MALALTAIPMGGYLELRGRTDAQSARLRELETRWAAVAQQQQAAEPGRAGIEALVKRWDSVVADGAGSSPRTTTDQFRQALEEQLQRHFRADGVTARFERLEEEAAPPSARLDRQKARFTIVAAGERSAGR